MKKPFIISSLFLLVLTLKLEMPFLQAINDVNPKKETLVLAIKELSLNPCRSSTLENKFKNYYLLDRDKISIKNSNKATLNFEFQLPDGKTFYSYLNRIDVVLPEGRCFVKTECGIEVNELNVSPIFSGQIDGYLQSRIFLMYSNDYFVCVIDIDENESYIIEPVVEDCGIINPSKLILYQTTDVIKTNIYHCLVDEINTSTKVAKESIVSSTCNELEIAQVADFSMWKKYGGRQGVIDRMASIIGLSQNNFDSSFQSQLFLRIAGIWLSACDTCDPWNSTLEISDLNGQFLDWSFQDSYFSQVKKDVGQLWTDRKFNQFVGWTTIKAICVLNAVQIIRDYTTDLDYQRCTVSHELGHSLGANHDVEGIMFPTATHSNTWSQKSQDEINPYIQELIQNKCLFPCTQGHFEFAKVAGEGFQNSDFSKIVEKNVFFVCEPIGFYLSFNQVIPNIELKFRTELIYPNGFVERETYKDFEVDTINKTSLRYSRERLGLVTGNFEWKIYQIASNGMEYLMDTQEFMVRNTDWDRVCLELLYLKFDRSIYDFSGLNNFPILKSGSVVYGDDRFENCNYAIKLSNSDYLEVNSLNERAISFWFKMEKPEQMIIYDGGPMGEEFKNWNVGIYKPGGLGTMTSFDTTFGLYFDIGSLAIAVPFDGLKSGWHFVAISRDISRFTNFRIMLDGKFSAGFVFDELDTINSWTKFDQQPFSFPSNRFGVPNRHDNYYKSYIGVDAQGEKIWGKGQSYFDGWLDEFHIYGKLLNEREMYELYTLKDPSPIEATITSTQYTCSSGDLTVKSTGSAKNLRYMWNTGDTTAVLSNLAPGQYSCIVSALVGECYHKKKLFGIIRNLPNPTIRVEAIIPSCKDQSNGLTFIFIDLPEPLNYRWSNNQTSRNLYNVPPGIYTVTVSKNIECSSVLTLTIPEYEKPEIIIDSISHTCQEKATGAAKISASKGKPPYFYFWNHRLNSQNLSNVQAGKYIANVSDANNCLDSQAITINEIPKCIADFTYKINGDTVLFTNNSTNENQSVWDFGDQQLSFVKNPEYIFKKSGIYKVCLTVTNQCNGSKYCQEIQVDKSVNLVEQSDNYLWSISPNPINGVLQIDLSAIEEKILSIEIYSSFGALVSKIIGPDQDFIQSYNCESFLSGIYYFKISTGNGCDMKRVVVE